MAKEKAANKKSSEIDKINEREELTLASREFPVAKTNDVIQKARTTLSLFEQKMLAYSLSKITGSDGDNMPELRYTLEIRDICATCGLYSDSGKVYSMIRRAFKKLLTPTEDWVRLRGKNGIDSYIPFRWMEKVKITPKKGTIDIMWDEEIAPFIFNLKKCFFSYPLHDVLAMRSAYSIRLYELLTSYSSLRGCKFELNELRSLLYNPSACHSYDRLADFRKRILDPSVEEINLYTQIDVSYELVFTERRCTHVRFAIDKKDPVSLQKSRSIVDKLLDGYSYSGPFFEPDERVFDFGILETENQVKTD